MAGWLGSQFPHVSFFYGSLVGGLLLLIVQLTLSPRETISLSENGTTAIEGHNHDHRHESLLHNHEHLYDDHQHEHDPGTLVSQPHAHPHQHTASRHRHFHEHDLHHLHHPG